MINLNQLPTNRLSLTITNVSEIREGRRCPFCADNRLVNVIVTNPTLGTGAYTECWHCSARGAVIFDDTLQESVDGAEWSWDNANRSSTLTKRVRRRILKIYWKTQKWFYRVIGQ